MPSRAYKEMTLQQLRSFCETARLGSFKAAATSLALSQPTVWAQVHALERQFGVKLVEPYGRGCRLTSLGNALLEHAAPLLEGIGTLRQSLIDCQSATDAHVTVATTPRILSEDWPEAVDAFEKRWPDVRRDSTMPFPFFGNRQALDPNVRGSERDGLYARPVEGPIALGISRWRRS